MKRHLQTKARLFPARNHAHTHVHQSSCPPSAKRHQSSGLLIAWLQERKEYFWDISVEHRRYNGMEMSDLCYHRGSFSLFIDPLIVSGLDRSPQTGYLQPICL